MPSAQSTRGPSWTGAAMLLVTCCTAPLRSQETPAPEATTPAPPDVGSAISVVLGLDWTSQYFFRGLVQENQGVILQPYADFTFTLHDDDEGWFNTFAINFGSWNSLHEGPTGNSGPNVDPEVWYESDFYAGVNLRLFGNWNLSATYYAYMSPNDFFLTIDEIDLSLQYDDSEFWNETVGVGLEGFTGFQPHVTFAFETENQGDGGMDEGNYFEVGIEPAFTLVHLGEEYPVTLAIPVTAGFSLGDYYELGDDDGDFGFVDLGLDASLPLSFVPGRFGGWNLALGAHFQFLGPHPEVINGGDDFEVILSAGLSCSF